MKSTTDYVAVKKIAVNDAVVLEEKGKSYGDSWKKRGGVGAFMMLARKWDRIENQCHGHGFNIFKAIVSNRNLDGILDDIRDLRRYLLLVESETEALLKVEEEGAATAGYTDQ